MVWHASWVAIGFGPCSCRVKRVSSRSPFERNHNHKFPLLKWIFVYFYLRLSYCTRVFKTQFATMHLVILRLSEDRYHQVAASALLAFSSAHCQSHTRYRPWGTAQPRWHKRAKVANKCGQTAIHYMPVYATSAPLFISGLSWSRLDLNPNFVILIFLSVLGKLVVSHDLRLSLKLFFNRNLFSLIYYHHGT